MKTVFITKEPILLGQFLKFSGLIVNGGEAKYFLENSIVFVNGVAENRRGKQLFDGCLVEINKQKYLIKLQK